MSFDIGTVEIPCPNCREPIAVTGTATGNPDGVTIRVDDERFRSTWRQHIIDKHPSEPYDGALLVRRSDIPPGGVTMLSNAGVLHLTAEQLGIDDEPSAEQMDRHIAAAEDDAVQRGVQP